MKFISSGNIFCGTFKNIFITKDFDNVKFQEWNLKVVHYNTYIIYIILNDLRNIF